MRENLETALKEKKKQDSILQELMEMIATEENLENATKKVKANKGVAGIDGITVEEIDAHTEKYKEPLLYKVNREHTNPNLSKESTFQKTREIKEP